MFTSETELFYTVENHVRKKSEMVTTNTMANRRMSKIPSDSKWIVLSSCPLGAIWDIPNL